MGCFRLVPLFLVVAGCAPSVPARLRSYTPADPFATLTLATPDKPVAPPSGKLTLAEAYELALRHDERVALAERDVIGANIESSARRNEVTPDVALVGTGTLQREVTTVNMAGREIVLAPSTQVIGAARLRQPLFRKGYLSSRDAGEQLQRSAEETRKRANEQLARDVAEVFITVLRSRKLLELAHTAVGRAKTQYDLAVGRVKAGQALKNVELLATIDLRRAEIQEVNAQRDAEAARVAFARLVGKDPPADMETPAIPALPDVEQAVATARGRADLRALEREVRAAKADETAAAGKRWWPRLDLEAGAQVLSPEVNNQGFGWNVTGVLTVPLLQSGVELSELARRENATHAAQLSLDLQRKLAVGEIEAAAIRAASAEKAAGLAQQQLDAAKEHYKLVDKQSRLGAITFLEVTNAQAVLVEAENTQEIATMDHMLAVYDYLFAIGALDLKSSER
jgi:outer membrane protein